MRDGCEGARTHLASGRFLCLSLAVATLVGGCQTVGVTPAPPPEPEGPAAVVVAPGPITRGEQDEAARLWASAQSSFQARRFFEVVRTTTDLVDRFPASDVSGEALRLRALSHRELGEPDQADAVAGRYIELLGPLDARANELLLLQVEMRAGDPERRLQALMRIRSGDDPSALTAAAELARDLADDLNLEELQSAVDSAPLGGPLASIVSAGLAVSLLEMAREEPARRYASRAIDGGATGDALSMAEGVLRGELPPGRGRTTVFQIGVVLPLSGPPALAEFSALIAEGIEVAAATVLGEDFTVTVEVRDTEGDPELGTRLVAELEAMGVAGVVGFLQDDELLAGAAVRTTAVPLVSPTARSAALAGEAVYSLEGPDPRAAESIARYAASRAFQRVALVYPETADASAEADAFERAAEGLGVPIVGRFTYPAGATFFEEPILSARDALRSAELEALALGPDDTLHVEMLEPAAIFLPIPPEDVEFLAPQVIHYGLDTLAIEVLGTSGWSDAATLEAIDARHTTGVVATAPLVAEVGVGGREAFQRAYEDYFQRSLVGATAAVGYDATLLLLEALRPGRIAPDAVRESFGELLEVQGATGIFSVVNGTIVRGTRVVRIDARVAVPLEVR